MLTTFCSFGNKPQAIYVDIYLFPIFHINIQPKIPCKFTKKNSNKQQPLQKNKFISLSHFSTHNTYKTSNLAYLESRVFLPAIGFSNSTVIFTSVASISNSVMVPRPKRAWRTLWPTE